MKNSLKTVWISALMTSLILLCTGLACFQAADVQRQVEQLQMEKARALGDLNALQKETIETPQQLSEHLQQAREAGQKAAEIQIRLSRMDSSKKPEEFEQAVSEMKEMLSSDDQFAGVPWYAGTSKAVWSFASAFEERKGQIRGIWKLEEDTLIAYATGSWNVKTGLFEDLHWGLTDEGLKTVQTMEDASMQIDWQENAKTLQETAREAGLID